jgi:predicted nucleic acid-binding protein
VILDVVAADARFGPGSRDAVRRCLTEGSLIACEVVWAEIAAAYPETAAARTALERLQVGFGPLDREAALEAGVAFRAYRRAGGTRQRLIGDFLIGAHAGGVADRLLTRDRGFYRTYFQGLALLDPSA